MNGGIDPIPKKFSPVLERERRHFDGYMRVMVVVLSIFNLILLALIVGIVLRSLGKGG